jgi:hypothetical protein
MPTIQWEAEEGFGVEDSWSATIRPNRIRRARNEQDGIPIQMCCWEIRTASIEGEATL